MDVFDHRGKRLDEPEWDDLEVEKPRVQLSDENGNIYNLGAIAANALKRAGQREAADEMKRRVSASKSYAEALDVIADYVEIE